MKSILYSFCIAVFFMQGCKSGTAKNATDAIPAPSSKSDASAIIDYTNALMDVLKDRTSFAKKSLEYYNDLEGYWAGKSSIKPLGNEVTNHFWVYADKTNIAYGKAPAALADTRAFFQDSVAKYREYFRKFYAQDSVLALYIKAEDFKDDKYAKGKEIIQQQFELYPALVRLRTALDDKIETVADAAEEVSLKDSPIRDAFKAAKGDLAKMYALSGLIADKEKYSDADIAAIDSAYADLNASIEKNKAIDKTNLDKESKTTQYNSLYTSLTNESAAIKPVIRDIKSTRKLTESGFNTVNNSYNAVVNSYNIWVR